MERSTYEQAAHESEDAMRHNPVPPPPRDWSNLPQWIKKTFPDGTSCMMREDRPAYSPSKHGHVLLPAGTKGRVVFTGDNVGEDGLDHWYLNEVELVFAPYPSYQIPDDAWLHLSWPEVWEVLEPLDDHWASTPKPMSRYSLPSSQKRTSRRLRPNVVPSVPFPTAGDLDDRIDWAQRTFAVGTPVKFLRSGDSRYGGGFRMIDNAMMFTVIPVESRGIVSNVYPGNWIVVEIVDSRDPASGTRRDDLIGQHVLASVTSAHYTLEPLVDNWAQPKYVSRRMRPNRQVSVHDFGDVGRAERFLKDRGFTFEGGKWSRGSLRATVGEYPHGVEVKTMTANRRRTSRKRTAKRTSRAGR